MEYAERKTVAKVRDRMNSQGIPQRMFSDGELVERMAEAKNTVTTAAKDPLKFARLILKYGPVISSQRERNHGLAILDRIEAGTASGEEQTWYRELLATIERSRKN